MKPTLTLLTTLLLAPLAALHAADVPKPKPNIIIHFIDDMGYGDIGPFGAVKQKTPHLDRMAREGMKLTSFYVTPSCSASRAQMMTGCYSVRVSVPAVFPPVSSRGLHPQEQTIADRLKPLGYATQCVGKWHLGDQPPFLPTKQGFDHYFGIPYSNDMQLPSSEVGRHVVPLMRDEKVERLLEQADQDSIEEIYTEEAVKFIRSSKDKPFFLYFPHTGVHRPIHPGKAFQGTSQNGPFGDWVQEVDASVGRVFDTLRELKLDQNTLVLFTSDNGPWLILGADGGSAGPLRGGKGTTWEGGVRVPTLAWWPGKIAPGSVCDAVTGNIDVLPTCLKIAGAEVPAEPVLDGRDLSPLLFGQSKDSPRDAHYYFYANELQAVRQGPWKLALVPQKNGLAINEVEEDAKTNPRLYHLDQDIGERTNHAAQHPEIVAKLTALAEKMNAEIGGNKPKSRRPAGVVENPVPLFSTKSKPKQSAASKAEKRPAPKAKAEAKPAESTPQIANTPAAAADEAERHVWLFQNNYAANAWKGNGPLKHGAWPVRDGQLLVTHSGKENPNIARGGLILPTEEANVVQIQLEVTAARKCQLSFTTGTSPSFDSQKMVEFDLTPDVKEYTLNLNAFSAWKDQVSKLRFDFLGLQKDETVRVSSIKVFTGEKISKPMVYATYRPGEAPVVKEFRAGSIFNSGMVLQRDKPLPVWGIAKPGEAVTVRFAGQERKTTADAAGKWSITLDPLPASAEPRTMEISSPLPGHRITFTNIVIGDVWLCSGQSNMGSTAEKNPPPEDRRKELLKTNYPNLRFVKVPSLHRDTPLPNDATEEALKWQPCRGVYAVSYYFGQSLHSSQKIPIGLVCVIQAGTQIEQYMSADTLNRVHPGDQLEKVAGKRLASGLYNGMIAPVAPFPLRGGIWYQGESNADDEFKTMGYYRSLPAFIGDWRRLWGADLPVMLVQLPSFKGYPPGSWAHLREAQMLTSLHVPNVGLAVTFDEGDPTNLHPFNKYFVGTRLGLAARSMVYGEKLESSGPMYSAMERRGAELNLRFTHIAGGLKARGELTGFEVRGANATWFPAKAKIADKETLVLSSPKVKEPQAARYAWKNDPVATLFNDIGLPASPFRTDVPAELIRQVEGKTAVVPMSPGTLSAQAKPAVAANPAAKPSSSPNFVVIMVDDMGYSDIGCFGGEVQTPNLDKLAAGGMRFTQFYNTAKCNSTRAELLTGNYASSVGMQSMEYGATFGEVLRGVGYRTLCTGKWHQSPHPMERGFDRYYGLWDGCANSFNQGTEARPGEGKPGRKSPKVIRRWAIEDQMIKGHTSPDPKFYMTDAFTTYAIDRLEEYKGEDKPFLLYLPYTAPHYPLHAWPEDIAKYRGKYKIGWDEIRKQRFARMQQLGIIDDRHQLTPREGRPWDSLTDAQKDEEDLKMAVYAAMIDRVDQNLGRLFAKLKELGKWDNTLILFLSDNGACPEEINNTPDIPPGPVESYRTLGLDWANASNTPYRNFKSTDNEGGIRSPFIAHWPKVIKPGQITDQFGHLIDISATFRGITGAAYPSEINGQKTKPPVGKSLLPVFRGEQREGHELVFFRYAHANAVRQGDLKAVRYRNSAWELYDLAKDPTEMKNLAEQMPEKTSELAKQWEAWSKESFKRP